MNNLLSRLFVLSAIILNVQSLLGMDNDDPCSEPSPSLLKTASGDFQSIDNRVPSLMASNNASLTKEQLLFPDNTLLTTRLPIALQEHIKSYELALMASNNASLTKEQLLFPDNTLLTTRLPIELQEHIKSYELEELLYPSVEEMNKMLDNNEHYNENNLGLYFIASEHNVDYFLVSYYCQEKVKEGYRCSEFLSASGERVYIESTSVFFPCANYRVQHKYFPKEDEYTYISVIMVPHHKSSGNSFLSTHDLHIIRPDGSFLQGLYLKGLYLKAEENPKFIFTPKKQV